MQPRQSDLRNDLRESLGILLPFALLLVGILIFASFGEQIRFNSLPKADKTATAVALLIPCKSEVGIAYATLREDPDTASVKIADLELGSKVGVTEVVHLNPDWAKVTTKSNKSGWMLVTQLQIPANCPLLEDETPTPEPK